MNNGLQSFRDYIFFLSVHSGIRMYKAELGILIIILFTILDNKELYDIVV